MQRADEEASSLSADAGTADQKKQPRRTFFDRVTDVLGALGGIAILVLMFLTTIDVVLRKTTGQGVGGTVEISEVVLVAAVFLGLPAAQASGAHVATTVVTSHLSERTRRVVLVAVGLISTLIATVMLYATTLAAATSVENGEYRFGLVHVPVWPARIIIPIGVLLLLIEFVRHLMRVWNGTEDIGEADEREKDASIHV